MFKFARGPFPSTRMRRVRRHDWSRRLVSECNLSVNDLIWPLFVHDASQPSRHREPAWSPALGYRISLSPSRSGL